MPLIFERDWLLKLGVVALIVVPLLVLVAPTARRACAGPVDVRGWLLPHERRGPAGAEAPTPRSTASESTATPVPATSPGSGWGTPVVDRLIRAFLAVKSADPVAYPGHTTAARVLGLFGCAPEAIAVQWLKAGSHARTFDQEQQVDTHLDAIASHFGGPDELTRFLTGYVLGSDDPRSGCTVDRLRARARGDAPTVQPVDTGESTCTAWKELR